MEAYQGKLTVGHAKKAPYRICNKTGTSIKIDLSKSNFQVNIQS